MWSSSTGWRVKVDRLESSALEHFETEPTLSCIYFHPLVAEKFFGLVSAARCEAQGDKIRIVAGELVGALGFVEKVDEAGILHMRATSLDKTLVVEVDRREAVKHFEVHVPPPDASMLPLCSGMERDVLTPSGSCGVFCD